MRWQRHFGTRKAAAASVSETIAIRRSEEVSKKEYQEQQNVLKRLKSEKELSDESLRKAEQTAKELAKTIKVLNADFRKKEEKIKSERKALNDKNQDLSKRLTALNQQINRPVPPGPVNPVANAPAKLVTTTTDESQVSKPAKLNELLYDQASPHVTTFKDGATFAFELLGKGQDLADRQAKSRMTESKQTHDHFVAAAGLHMINGSTSSYQLMQHPLMPTLLQPPPYIFPSGYSGGYYGQSAPHGQMLHTPGQFPSQHSQCSFTPMQYMMYPQAMSHMPPHQAVNHTAGPPSQYHYGAPIHGQVLSHPNIVPKLPDDNSNL